MPATALTPLAAIQADQLASRMPRRKLVAADFVRRRAMMLPPAAHYKHLLALPKGSDLGAALVAAMNAIEADFEPLRGQLPKDYDRFDACLLEDLLRAFDTEALRRASGDVFGRIYEYFLMKFAMQGAQDNGEFFTPPSLVQMIVNLIEPNHGAPGQDEPGGAWAGRRHPRCQLLLRRRTPPARRPAARKALEAARGVAVDHLKQVRHFQRHAAWLIERFPQARYCDVQGLCKAVTRADIEAADWSLTPGRYVVGPAKIRLGPARRSPVAGGRRRSFGITARPVAEGERRPRLADTARSAASAWRLPALASR